MLNIFRKNTKTIIWIVVIAFLMWGGYAASVSMKEPNLYAGELFGKKIPYQEYNSIFKASQIFSFSSKRLENPDEINTHTWQSLMFIHEAKKEKLNVSDEEVRDEIKRLLTNAKIENPTREFYENWLKGAFQTTPRDFENMIREMIRLQKLIKKINEAPVLEPTEAELREKFTKEKSTLSLEIYSLPTQEEMTAFVKKSAADAQAWAKETEGKTQKTGLANLESLVTAWQIPPQIAESLMTLPADQISEPFPRSNQWSAAKVVEKKSADEKEFTEEVKKKMSEEIQNQLKYDRFEAWFRDLQKKAALKDYTPKSKFAEPSVPVPAAPPAEPASAV